MSEFKPGDLVVHQRLGRGRIVEQWGAWTDIGNNDKPLAVRGERVFEVEFQSHGRRSVSSCRLRPERNQW